MLKLRVRRLLRADRGAAGRCAAIWLLAVHLLLALAPPVTACPRRTDGSDPAATASFGVPHLAGAAADAPESGSLPGAGGGASSSVSGSLCGGLIGIPSAPAAARYAAPASAAPPGAVAPPPHLFLARSLFRPPRPS